MGSHPAGGDVVSNAPMTLPEDCHQLHEDSNGHADDTLETVPRRSDVEAQTNRCAATVPVEKNAAPTVADGDAQVAGFNAQTRYLPTSRILVVFAAVASVIFSVLIDQTTLAVSTPTIAADLRAGTRSSFISDSYFITSSAFQLIYGRVSDFTGRKPLLLALLAIFFLGSLGSSLSPNVISLVIFRAFTGIGGGGLITVAQIIISDVVSLRERGKYQGMLGAFVVLGNGLGPLIGGLLAQKASWRDQYRMMLPLSAFAGVIAWRFLPLKKVQGDWRRKVRAIDWTGAFLSLAATLLIVLGLSWAGGSYPWDDAHVLAPLLLGGVVAVCFVLWQWKGCTEDRPPLMPLGMFRNGVVVGAAITQMLNGWLQYQQVFSIPQFYQLAYGYTPIVAAALTIPLLTLQTLTSTTAGLIMSKTGRYRELLLSGWACWSIGLGLFATLDETSGKSKQIGYALLTGFGIGQTLQTGLVALQGAVPREQMAVVTAMRNFARNLGGAIGLAIGYSIVSTTTISRLGPLGWSASRIRSALSDPSQVSSPSSKWSVAEAAELRTAYIAGFRYSFYLLASLAAVSFVVTLFLLRQQDLDRDDDASLKARGKQEVSSAR
ncbi:unnamed protein product [Parajaminaea phylloscopi]